LGIKVVVDFIREVRVDKCFGFDNIQVGKFLEFVLEDIFWFKLSLGNGIFFRGKYNFDVEVSVFKGLSDSVFW
jgi:hypothetical protein